MRIGSLCTGYGGLDLALRSVMGGDFAWHSDIDKNAIKILEHHWPDVPNIGDVKTVDWNQVEPVDWLTAGYPCQPFSNAGLRRGTDDPRHLWPHISDGIRVLRPGYVLLENVRGHVGRGLREVVADLADLGYVGSWLCLRASEVGAPHRRERVFILAVEDSDGAVGDERWPAAPGEAQSRGSRADVGGRGSFSPPDSRGERHGGRQDDRVVGELDCPQEGADGERQRSRQVAGDRGPETSPDSDGTGLEGWDVLRGGASERTAGSHSVVARWGEYEFAIRRWERLLGRAAPSPTEPGPHGGRRLSSRFEEWMMGLPEGWVTSVPGLSRNAQIKALGNGVVPQQAVAAIERLTA